MGSRVVDACVGWMVEIKSSLENFFINCWAFKIFPLSLFRFVVGGRWWVRGC